MREIYNLILIPIYQMNERNIQNNINSNLPRLIILKRAMPRVKQNVQITTKTRKVNLKNYESF